MPRQMRLDGLAHADTEPIPLLGARRTMPDRPLMPDVLDDPRIRLDDLLERLAFPTTDMRLHELIVEVHRGTDLMCERLCGLGCAPERDKYTANGSRSITSKRLARSAACSRPFSERGGFHWSPRALAHRSPAQSKSD